VTRSREQASRLVDEIENLDGEVIEFPTIKISEPQDYEPVDKALNNLTNYKWLVFTSVNGVTAFFNRLKTKKIDIRNLWGAKICAVGEATAAELGKSGLNADYVPGSYTTADLAKGLQELVKPGEKVLLARADIASKELTESLRNNNIDFDDLIVYRTLLESSDREEVLGLLNEDKIDFITFTSSSTVRNFVSLIGSENIYKLSAAKVVCIGPVTMDTAKELGINVTAMADIYTIDGLVNKLVEISEV
jgi:uroporphyrinogen III methyltransferase / synthase